MVSGLTAFMIVRRLSLVVLPPLIVRAFFLAIWPSVLWFRSHSGLRCPPKGEGPEPSLAPQPERRINRPCGRLVRLPSRRLPYPSRLPAPAPVAGKHEPVRRG